MSLAHLLASSGMAEEDARKLAHLAASERPDSDQEPMGPKVEMGFSRISRRQLQAFGNGGCSDGRC